VGRTSPGSHIANVRDSCARLAVPRPSALDFGLAESSIPAIVAGSRGSSRKTNPIVLTDDEIGAILRASL